MEGGRASGATERPLVGPIFLHIWPARFARRQSIAIRFKLWEIVFLRARSCCLPTRGRNFTLELTSLPSAGGGAQVLFHQNTGTQIESIRRPSARISLCSSASTSVCSSLCVCVLHLMIDN